MSSRSQSEQAELEEALNNAVDLTDDRISYVTNIRFGISNNDVTLDLFYTSRNPNDPDGKLLAKRLHRLVLPLGLAKNISQLLADAMAQWEEAFGIDLPLTLVDTDDSEGNENDSN